MSAEIFKPSEYPEALEALEVHEARFALRVGARLSEASSQLPHDLSERLRVARQRALAQRKREISAPAPGLWAAGGGSLVMGGGNGPHDSDPRPSFWWQLASALPLLALVVGLLVIDEWHAYSQIRELADIDSALLIDDLPPTAYADPGFVEFLKASR